MQSNGVFVPGQGFFIVGGDVGSTQARQAQKLDSINGNWLLGPSLYLSQPEFGQCYLQVGVTLYLMKSHKKFENLI